MFLNLFLFALLSVGAAFPWGRAVISTGSKDIVNMSQLDPHEKVLPHLDDVRRQVYDTPYEIDDKGNTREALFEGCDIQSYDEDIEDNVSMVVNCRVRLAVFFHDGIQLTAQDIEFSINRLKRSKTLSSYLDFIESCTPINNYNVQFILKYRTPSVRSPKEWLFTRFKAVLARYVYIVRARYFEGNRNWALDYPVGTGPFYFIDWKIWEPKQGRSQLVLAKNKSYWKKEYPKLEHLVFRFLPEEMWKQQMEQGFLSLVLRSSGREYENFARKNRKNVLASAFKKPRYSYQYLLFSPYSKYMQSRELKTVLLNSIQRERLSSPLGTTARVNYGQAVRASVIFPDRFPVTKYSPNSSRHRLLEYLKARRSTFPGDYRRGYIRLNLLAADNVEDLIIAEGLKKQLAASGLSVKVTKLPSEKYNAAMNEEDLEGYDLILYSTEENPSLMTPSVMNTIALGGMELYQRSLVYMMTKQDPDNIAEPYADALTRFIPPAEGPIMLRDVE